ncbi:translocon at the outer membrane of chloroplasts 64-like [Humulus lupulus]|uniref:translocon at the outer membrane of chloroplasts 64-like n=1 Tax=Humulus lupulus TaxID=3486 RepID=UPI002B4116AF|nr:translocon at the outer membrane of chloroplasts 64-like [Humulus lupulus]
MFDNDDDNGLCRSGKRDDLLYIQEKLEIVLVSCALSSAQLFLQMFISSFTIDRFDIDGQVTGFGHPDWARTHEAASGTCPVVSTLVEGGATCIGKTVVDELAYGISGENKHYGVPTNPAVPERVPGGSSSGASVAVAAKLVDFSLGIDTIGDVRVPAGFCGVLGFRPSHGAVSQMRIVPVSSRLDTVGWFAMDHTILRRVGHVLLQLPYAPPRNPRQVIIADDCFQLGKIPAERIVQVVIKSTEKIFGRQILKHENLGDYLSSKVPSLKVFQSKQINGQSKTSSLGSLATVMQIFQRHEFRNNHEEWINLAKPVLDPAISSIFQETPDTTGIDVENCKAIRSEMRLALNALLKDEGILVIPTIADPPPKVGGKEILSEQFQSRAFSLLSIASISGCR